MKTNRAVSVSEIFSKKRNLLPFEGKFKDSFGTPELDCIIFIWGESSHGKTSLAMQLAKYMCELNYRVGYNSIEQGNSLSFKYGVEREGLIDERKRFILLDREPMTDTIVRYKKHKSPDVLFIDTIQYSRLKLDGWIDLKCELRGKMIVVVSQAKGEMPKGALADNIRFDADIKIHVKGFKGFVESRVGGEVDYVIDMQKSLEYWGLK